MTAELCKIQFVERLHPFSTSRWDASAYFSSQFQHGSSPFPALGARFLRFRLCLVIMRRWPELFRQMQLVWPIAHYEAHLSTWDAQILWHEHWRRPWAPSSTRESTVVHASAANYTDAMRLAAQHHVCHVEPDVFLNDCPGQRPRERRRDTRLALELPAFSEPAIVLVLANNEGK